MQAGVERLQSFGGFATYVQLARNGAIGNTIDEILKQPVRVVYNLLWYDMEYSQYESRLSDILRKKK
jgi:hypothetical protein